MTEQNEQPKVKKKGGALKWTGIGCGGLLLLIILMGACTIMIMPSSDTETSTAGTDESESTTEEEAPEDKTYTVGETASDDGKEITVTNVEKRQAGEYEVVKEGYEFVIVSVEIVNRSDEEINYNPFDFELKDGNGNITDSFGTTSLEGIGENLSSGALAPDGNVSGTIAYEVPIDDEDLTLRYISNMFSNDTIDFNLYE